MNKQTLKEVIEFIEMRLNKKDLKKMTADDLLNFLCDWSDYY